MYNLIIVESPAKAKTIKKYLNNNYKIISCNGHIRDLLKGPEAINIKHKKKFKVNYEINNKKKKIITKLEELSKSSNHIYLASDNDREGESIS